MIERVSKPKELAGLLAMNAPDGLIDASFNPAAWLADPRNIALRIENDLAMFAHCGLGIVHGHVWFASRGKPALERGRQMLDEIFVNYGIQTIKGETPVWCKAALAFTAKLGFKQTGWALRPQGKVIVSALESHYANLSDARLVA